MVLTRKILSDGTIFSGHLADFEFESESTHRPVIFGITGRTFGIVHADSLGNGELVTIDISLDGEFIGAIATLVFADEKGVRNRGLHHGASVRPIKYVARGHDH